jgi:2-polyprenyl-6-hydroxyphenyl methylase/3-demethylubiquinone-9 3-methyltransferase
MTMRLLNDAGAAEQLFTDCGGTDFDYLRHHFPRFEATLGELNRGWSPEIGARVLDVGAHWLHQAALFSAAGYQVSAVDLPLTLEQDCVRRAAERLGIGLHPVANLADPVELDHLPDDSFDLILFSEIIEHITFNPVRFWRQMYRLLRPGGRIVVTTPNYYSPYSRLWDWRRILRGLGGGISVDEILRQHTYAHHWKEYSARELIYYFLRLSADFNTVKARHLPAFDRLPPPIPLIAKLAYAIQHRDPRQCANIYLEVELAQKRAGVQIEPSW